MASRRERFENARLYSIIVLLALSLYFFFLLAVYLPLFFSELAISVFMLIPVVHLFLTFLICFLMFKNIVLLGRRDEPSLTIWQILMGLTLLSCLGAVLSFSILEILFHIIVFYITSLGYDANKKLTFY